MPTELIVSACGYVSASLSVLIVLSVSRRVHSVIALEQAQGCLEATTEPISRVMLMMLQLLELLVPGHPRTPRVDRQGYESETANARLFLFRNQRLCGRISPVLHPAFARVRPHFGRLAGDVGRRRAPPQLICTQSGQPVSY
jgi:hypothetical protein